MRLRIPVFPSSVIVLYEVSELELQVFKRGPKQNLELLIGQAGRWAGGRCATDNSKIAFWSTLAGGVAILLQQPTWETCQLHVGCKTTLSD